MKKLKLNYCPDKPAVQLYVFPYTGFGNYSTDHGWDEGLTTIIQEQPLRKAYAGEYGVRCHWFETGAGSRNDNGIVVAENYNHARQLLDRYVEAMFPVTYYNEPAEPCYE